MKKYNMKLFKKYLACGQLAVITAVTRECVLQCNIKNENIRSLLSFKNPRMKKYIKERIECMNRCEKSGCEYIPTCQYGCPYMSLINSDDGSISKKDYLCEGKRKVMNKVNELLHFHNVKTYTQINAT